MTDVSLLLLCCDLGGLEHSLFASFSCSDVPSAVVVAVIIIVLVVRFHSDISPVGKDFNVGVRVLLSEDGTNSSLLYVSISAQKL